MSFDDSNALVLPTTNFNSQILSSSNTTVDQNLLSNSLNSISSIRLSDTLDISSLPEAPRDVLIEEHARNASQEILDV